MEKQYSQEVQCLCKTSAFGSAVTEDIVGYRNTLNIMVAQAKATALLLSSLVLSVRLRTSLKNQVFNLNSMKLVAILIILYRSVY